jgi:hypothetical protein
MVFEYVYPAATSMHIAMTAVHAVRAGSVGVTPARAARVIIIATVRGFTPTATRMNSVLMAVSG